MSSRKTDDTFIDDACAWQPRVIVTLDGGIPLTNAERALRDGGLQPFVDDLLAAVRAHYDVLRQLGERQ